MSDAGRVLVVHSSSETYGSDRALLGYASGLVRRGWDVRVVVPAAGPLSEALERAGVRVRFLDPGVFRRVYTPSGWLRFAARLPGAVRALAAEARHADVVHVNTSVTIGGALGARLARRPLVWHLREAYVGHPILGRAYLRFMRLVSSAIVCESEGTKQIATQLGAGTKTTVVHNGAEFFEFVPAVARPARVCVVGRINDWKGQDVFVEALAALAREDLHVSGVIAGDVFPGGERYRTELIDSIKRHGLADQVELAGFVDDVESLLRRCSIYAMPSKRPEPFGISLIEAMGQGLACIATDAGGPREIIRDGETGLLVRPNDPPHLAEAIRRLWSDDDLRRRLGESAAADVRRRFSVEQMTDGVEAVYRAVRR